MITQKEFSRRFKPIKEFLDDLDQMGVFVGSLLTGGPPTCNFGSNFLSAYADLLSAYVGDIEDGWIDWYIWENDMGKKRMEAGYDGKLSKISSLKHLYKLIKQGQEANEIQA